ncbi:MAG: carboxypeptidase-like regulatory domain-containing protein [Bacteroidales bacterium]|nr:carboxypeptidase-like regulatory domain-containing protein [Bacteroidales bacterium]
MYKFHKALKVAIVLTMVCLFNIQLSVLQAQTVSGTVTDAATGETLIGATVLDVGSGKGTVTNAYGRYTLTLKGSSTVELKFSYVGYTSQVMTVDMGSNPQLNIKLQPNVQLQEVEIVAERIGSPKMSQMSAIEVPVEQIKLVPVIFGETDVLKAIQLLPGVQSGTEGMSGIYVRGGGPDQNLFLLDGIPLYNVNHLGGFFSAFNGDAIKNVTLYKGSFPARFSGRISSVLDITSNNGNDKEWHGGFSVGLISAKVNVEGPIIKEKTTLTLSLRRTYGDAIIRPAMWIAAAAEPSLKGLAAGYYFYDLNAKVTHKFSDRSRLYATWYSGDDEAYMRVKVNDSFYDEKEYLKLSYRWGNLATAVRWNYELTQKLFMNVTGSYTRYRNRLTLGVEEEWYEQGQLYSDEVEMGINSGIQDFAGRVDFDYAPSPEHNIKFGGIATLHTFIPQVQSARMQFTGAPSLDTTFGESRIHAGEFTLYAEDDWSIAEALKINGGVALTGFNVEGCFYPSVQPRLSGRLMLGDDLSIKAGYSYMTQYMHLLSNSNISLPTDLWVPVTARIKPMNSHQVAAGVFYTWRSLVDFSIEGYYKWMNNLLEYKPGSTFLGSSVGWEDMVCMGRGWAYGVEFLAQKSVGDITGWLGYTWSRTMRLFDTPGQELNNGQPFPAKYDRIHDLSITLQYKPSNRFDCGVTWVYSTGNTATLALQEIAGDDDNSYWSRINYVDSRNNFRLPPYHRMDVSVNFHKQLRHGLRTWNISVYNLYNRQNPFMIYPVSRERSDSQGTHYSTVLMQRSLFPIIPSVSLIYKF